MKILLLSILATLALATTAGAAKPVTSGGPIKSVQVYVVVPAAYSSTVTPAQGEAFVRAAIGSRSDAPCIGSHSCSIEGWFKHELGQTFDYTVETINASFSVPTSDPNSVDSCGSTSGPSWYWTVASALTNANVSLTKNDRVAVLLMGGGGWAGHFAPTDNVPAHLGMAGDWGAMRMFDSMNACATSYFAGLPAEDAASGFAHEFAGMMGAYAIGGYGDGGLYQGDPMGDSVKKALLRYSGKWLS